MARPLAKSTFVLVALGLWILACPASLAKAIDPRQFHEPAVSLYILCFA
jgi:hypothetical protein